MRRNRRSSFARIAALIATSMTGLEMTPPRRTIISTEIIPCTAIPDPRLTDYTAWSDTVWADAPRIASQIDCI